MTWRSDFEIWGGEFSSFEVSNKARDCWGDGDVLSTFKRTGGGILPKRGRIRMGQRSCPNLMGLLFDSFGFRDSFSVP